MYNFVVPNRFKTQTCIGNWYEERQFDEYQLKDYLYAKEAGGFTSAKKDRIAHSLQPVLLSSGTELLSGQTIALRSARTKLLLRCNIEQKLTAEDAFAASTGAETPVLSSSFTITKQDAGPICYGDVVRISTLPDLAKQPYFLQSVPMNPQRSAKISRYQQISFASHSSSSTLWSIDHEDPRERFSSKGKPVERGSLVIIRHVNTGNNLGSDLLKYPNDFGVQYEVYAKTQSSFNKYQKNISQKEGRSVVQIPSKFEQETNAWLIQ